MKLPNLLSAVSSLLFFSFVLMNNLAVADHGGPGPSFSDPAHIEILPEAWLKQPIKYKDAPEDSDLAIVLDQHLYPALLPIIQKFANQKQLKIAVQEGTCGISAGSLIDKKVDIGGFCCPAGETDRLPGLRFHTLGIASLALITHPTNPTDDVTLKQSREIFWGGIASWDQLAGDKNKNQQLPAIGPIHPIARLHCKKRPGHWRLILADEDHFSPVIQEVGTISDMIQRVSEGSNAVGFETLWMTRLHHVRPVKTLKIDGYSPEDSQAVVDRHYPFYRSYNITSWASSETRKPLAGELVEYIKNNFDSVEPKYGFISSNRLRESGWQFYKDELIGEPK